MKRIIVLLSSYNGEKYLRQQLDSIIGQDCGDECNVKLSLLVRDDGSKDLTAQILGEYQREYPDKIFWYQGENIGVVDSFFDLLCRSASQYGQPDYYAFADQDDYWLPHKLSAGINHLEQMEEECLQQEGRRDVPLLYCGAPTLVDEQLCPINSGIDRSSKNPGFANALIENVANGCTMIINRELCDMLTGEKPQFVIMHDWWIYLTASCFGRVYYDSDSYLYYRQHAGNVLGNASGRGAELLDRLRRLRGSSGNASRQAAQFARIFADRLAQVEENAQLLEDFLEGKHSLSRRRRALRRGLYRQRREDQVLYRWLILMNWY